MRSGVRDGAFLLVVHHQRGKLVINMFRRWRCSHIFLYELRSKIIRHDLFVRGKGTSRIFLVTKKQFSVKQKFAFSINLC